MLNSINMALITFMSDFGTVDHYVAAVKAYIFSSSPTQQIIDITHDIRPFDISHASYVLRSVYKDFPPKTVHLVAVDAIKEKSKTLAVEIDNHLFVGFDSGLFSLISENKPDQIVLLEDKVSTFSAKDVLAKASIQLANGTPLKNIGTVVPTMTKLSGRQLKVTKREIAGNVISVDRYGNLITNISKYEFDTMLEMNGKGVKYKIRLGREEFYSLHTHFSDVESGNCFILFNSSNQLQIGINKGNASELLGVFFDSPIVIEFITE